MFASRVAAGKLLASKLKNLQVSAQVVYGITRGGVVVAAEIAQSLKLPLIPLPVKKLGAPNNPELALGAVAPDAIQYLDSGLANVVGASDAALKRQVKRLQTEIKHKMAAYKVDLEKTYQKVILTDDGIATGATVYAAIDWLRYKGITSIILALPVAPRETITRIAAKVEQIVVLETPENFSAVGQFYQEFGQVSDTDVSKILSEIKKKILNIFTEDV